MVNGQKVWTSGVHDADYCMCYVRTDPEASKHRGISVLIIDMRTPGITCRPLPELTDPHHADFNEVFFTDVEVPAENLLGELHHGRAVSQGSLRHERGTLWIMYVEDGAHAEGAGAHGRASRRPRRHPRRRPAPGRSHRSAGHRHAAMRCLGYRGFAKATRGDMSPEHMVLKLFTSEAEQRACLLGEEALDSKASTSRAPAPTASPSGTSATSKPARPTIARSAPSTTAPGPCSTCVPSPAPSPAGPRRSSATSWPSVCLACPAADRGRTGLLRRPAAGANGRRAGRPAARRGAAVAISHGDCRCPVPLRRCRVRTSPGAAVPGTDTGVAARRALGCDNGHTIRVSAPSDRPWTCAKSSSPVKKPLRIPDPSFR